jgi:hypothetical protein
MAESVSPSQIETSVVYLLRIRKLKKLGVDDPRCETSGNTPVNGTL